MTSGIIPRSLADCALEINKLGERLAGNLLEIGRHAADAREILRKNPSLPTFKAWVADNVDFDLSYVYGAIRCHERFGGRERPSIPVTGLMMLSNQDVPDEAVSEALARSGEGERLTVAAVRQIISDARRAALPGAEPENRDEQPEIDYDRPADPEPEPEDDQDDNDKSPDDDSRPFLPRAEQGAIKFYIRAGKEALREALEGIDKHPAHVRLFVANELREFIGELTGE